MEVLFSFCPCCPLSLSFVRVSFTAHCLVFSCFVFFDTLLNQTSMAFIGMLFTTNTNSMFCVVLLHEGRYVPQFLFYPMKKRKKHLHSMMLPLSVTAEMGPEHRIWHDCNMGLLAVFGCMVNSYPLSRYSYLSFESLQFLQRYHYSLKCFFFFFHLCSWYNNPTLLYTKKAAWPESRLHTHGLHLEILWLLKELLLYLSWWKAQ